MVAMNRPIIGVIFPGNSDSELRHLDAWTMTHGLATARFVLVNSQSDGSHAIAALEQTADLQKSATAAATLAAKSCAAVIWACTSGSFVLGLARSRQQADAIAEIVGAPATSASLALARAAAHLGHTVEVLSPYDDEVSRNFVNFLREADVEVSALTCLGSASAAQSRSIDLAQEIELHHAAHGWSPLPLLIPDTAIDTLSLVVALEERFRRPLVTANQACLWDGLETSRNSVEDQPGGADLHAARTFAPIKMKYLLSLDFSPVWQYWGQIGFGSAMTLFLWLFSGLSGLTLGTVLAVLGQSKHRLVRLCVDGYIEIWRNTPLLVQLFWIHFALPTLIGFTMTALQSGLLALTGNVTAYFSEIIRAGIQAVDRGQWDAGNALGLHRYALWRTIIFPQVLRTILRH